MTTDSFNALVFQHANFFYRVHDDAVDARDPNYMGKMMHKSYIYALRVIWVKRTKEIIEYWKANRRNIEQTLQPHELAYVFGKKTWYKLY